MLLANKKKSLIISAKLVKFFKHKFMYWLENFFLNYIAIMIFVIGYYIFYYVIKVKSY